MGQATCGHCKAFIGNFVETPGTDWGIEQLMLNHLRDGCPKYDYEQDFPPRSPENPYGIPVSRKASRRLPR